ncbi:hypothetical protein, partial [Burkholderia sp. ABCPW 14]|uniref:hypothetical protein n=1 Tax=Burkholderia sp. ABCPW 14 TaxID=1637860 RepID=UPI0012E37805
MGYRAVVNFGSSVACDKSQTKPLGSRTLEIARLESSFSSPGIAPEETQIELLRITESMTTDFLPVRYTVITLNGGSVDGQNGRSYAQAGACWSADVGGQNAGRSSQG